jgi:outer membrane protein assembly factor BamA
MIHQLYKKFLFTLLVSIPLYSQSIQSIAIEGNQTFSKAEYLNWSDLSVGQKLETVNFDSTKGKIVKQLANNGFFKSSVKFITKNNDSSTVTLSLFINEGKPTFINKINISSSDSSSFDFISEKFGFLEGERFISANFEYTASEVLDYFENKGNPFAKVLIESLYFFEDEDSTSLVDVYILFESERKSIVDEIRITGNDKTKNYVITRNSRISIGDEYSQEKVEQVPKILNRLRFFEPVKTPLFYFSSQGKGVLEISIKEKETNSFDGIVGYVPATTGGGDGFFTGFVNINLRNLFGTERAALFKWEKEDAESQELEIKYLEPWLFGYPFNIELGIHQRKQDTTYVQRKLEGKIEFLATDEISASFLISTESTIPTDPDNRGFTVFNSTSLNTGASLKFDTRDDLYAPTEGFLFTNTYLFSTKEISGPEQFINPSTKQSIELQKFELGFSYFYEIFNRQVIAAGIHGRELKGDLLEISDLYRLGGTNTLRGYRENQFLGNRIFWSNLEYRYLLTPRSYAFVFFDTGYYLRNADPAKSIVKIESFKTGYGLGLSIETGLGLMGISFALGQGDSFSEGKIHFGLLNEF